VPSLNKWQDWLIVAASYEEEGKRVPEWLENRF
jgi:hypothetical protein